MDSCSSQMKKRRGHMEKVEYRGMTMIFKHKAPCRHDVAEIYNLLKFKEEIKRERKENKKC